MRILTKNPINVDTEGSNLCCPSPVVIHPFHTLICVVIHAGGVLRLVCEVYKSLIITISLDELICLQCTFILVRKVDVNVFIFEPICRALMNKGLELPFPVRYTIRVQFPRIISTCDREVFMV